MKALHILAVGSAVGFILALLIITAPALAGPSGAKCHHHAGHTHCH